MELKKEFLKSSSSSIATLTHSIDRTYSDSDSTDRENVLSLTPENSVWMVRTNSTLSSFLLPDYWSDECLEVALHS